MDFPDYLPHSQAWLEELEHGRGGEALPDLYWILASKGHSLRPRASRIPARILAPATARELVRLDTFCRRGSSGYSSGLWKSLSPEALIPAEASARDRLFILGLASFHSNGYFREKAVRLLARIRDPEAVRFLMLRVNDWVPEVRAAADAALLDLPTRGFAGALAEALPLLTRLGSGGRIRIDPLMQRIRGELTQDMEAMRACLASRDPWVRRNAVEMAAASTDFPVNLVLERLPSEPRPDIRAWALEVLRSHRSKDELADIGFGPLWGDASAQVRCRVLELHCHIHPAGSRERLLENLASPSGQLRGVARRNLVRTGFRDIAAWYRSSLGTLAAPNVGALLGLGETGGKDDFDTLLPFLSVDSPAPVRAAMRGLPLLDADRSREALLRMITDQRPGVSKEARNLLDPSARDLPVDVLRLAMRESPTQHVRRNAFRLIRRMGPWDSLGPILEAAAEGGLGLTEEASKACAEWEGELNTYFIRPTPDQVGRIREDLGRWSGSKREHFESIIRARA